MKLTIDAALEAKAQEIGDAFLSSFYSSGKGLPDWTVTEERENEITHDAALLEAFTIATKYLQSTRFAKDILEEWRDERSDGKEDDPTYSMSDFMEDMGYLEGFTGRNLTQLVKYYLSPRAIDDGSWSHMGTFTSDDGVYVAHQFCPVSFREHDGIMWFQEVATGRGVAIPYDAL